MKTNHLEHKYGGKITALTAIEHGTGPYGAWWDFIGRIAWPNEGVSEDMRISPAMLCFDHDNPMACAEYDAVMAALATYRSTHGRMDDRGHWLPSAKAGRAALD